MVPKYIIVHTAADGGLNDSGKPRPNRNTTYAQIDSWHKANGWRYFGYHGLVDLNGKFYPGRKEDETGAHCTSMNMNSQALGLCMSGHGDYYKWTEPQYQTMLRIVFGWCKKYNIPFSNVMGHRETGAHKSCPGTKIDCSEIREDLALMEAKLATTGVLSLAGKTAARLAFTTFYSKVLWPYLPYEVQQQINVLRKQIIFNNI